MSNRLSDPQNPGLVNKFVSQKVGALNKEIKNLRVFAKQVKEGAFITQGTQVLSSHGGPLPVSGHFTTHGGAVLMTVCGSGFRGVTGRFTMNITVDGSVLGTCEFFTNEINSHKTLVPTVLVFTPPAGSHTVTLSNGTNMSSDSNDFYSISVIEFPV